MSDKNSNMDNLGQAINDVIKDINFKEISQNIKKNVDQAVNSSLNMMKKNANKTAPAKNKNPKVCAQKLPQKSKASGLKILSMLIAISFLPLGLIFLLSVLSSGYFMGIGSTLGQLLLSAIFITIGLGLPIIFWRRAKFFDKLGKDYVRFLREMGNNTVIQVRDLASAIQKSEDETIKELLYMMKNGYFHQARIVENDSLFLLDIDTFKLYKNQKNEMQNKVETEEVEIEEGSQEEVAKEIIEKASALNEEIKKNADQIQNQDFVSKANSINQTVDNLINLVDKYPEKSYGLNKFMDYFLPTTVKLVESYKEFEQMNLKDEKFQESMADIEESMDELNQAFKKMQVQMLEDRTMDVKSDIETMKLLLNQEGLLNDDFKEE